MSDLTTPASYEATDFAQDVIRASFEKPVLVDFWAPWCGPCRVLGPVLEGLARRQADRWRLVKINTDEHPEIAMQYGIQGIPAVKLFVDGQVVSEFTGALPEHQVLQWLDQALPGPNRQALEQAKARLEAGDAAAARTLLEEVLRQEPENEEARLLLAQAVVFEDPARAAELAHGTAVDAGSLLTAEAIETVARLYEADEHPETLPEAPVKPEFLAAVRAMRERRFEEAIQGFIEIIQKDRAYDDDGARKACAALFTLLGEPHPLVKQYRRRFGMALY